MEGQIIYLPVYPDEADSEFQKEFFEKAPNDLLEVLPYAGDYASVLHLIDVPRATGGSFAQIVADPQSHKAVCFLDQTTTFPREQNPW